MDFDIPSIFHPSVGVDIIADLNSLTPYSRPSIIYDTDFDNQTIIIAEPSSPLPNSLSFKELHLSTIIQSNKRRIRIGIPCLRYKRVEDFLLASNKKTVVLKIVYEPPATEINIRSAFRLPVGRKYMVKGKVLLNQDEFYTPKDFTIKDISLTGLGIAVPKKINQRLNPLSQIQQTDSPRLGIILIDMDQETPLATIRLKTQIARVNLNYSDQFILAGLRITDIKDIDESVLAKFIHDAQIHELKRLSGREI